IKLDSKGPVFFRQLRHGRAGSEFHIFKFRTMVQDAEAQRFALAEQNDLEGGGPLFKLHEDPRVTRIGRFLRKSSIDELPQLINVLLGDMSLVGPRPERPVFISRFAKTIPSYMARHRVKAGITGWAQVNGWRGNTSLQKRIEYDLYYIENWSVGLDIKIMWLTVLKGIQKHAY
ncbi:MAG TPA: sugar transferase, partial [Vicinamibacterales bacterium]|nr:sugar transferase [Vicinamibacterales bacterium]